MWGVARVRWAMSATTLLVIACSGSGGASDAAGSGSDGEASVPCGERSCAPEDVCVLCEPAPIGVCDPALREGDSCPDGHEVCLSTSAVQGCRPLAAPAPPFCARLLEDVAVCGDPDPCLAWRPDPTEAWLPLQSGCSLEAGEVQCQGLICANEPGGANGSGGALGCLSSVPACMGE